MAKKQDDRLAPLREAAVGPVESPIDPEELADVDQTTQQAMEAKGIIADISDLVRGGDRSTLQQIQKGLVTGKPPSFGGRAAAWTAGATALGPAGIAIAHKAVGAAAEKNYEKNLTNIMDSAGMAKAERIQFVNAVIGQMDQGKSDGKDVANFVWKYVGAYLANKR